MPFINKATNKMGKLISSYVFVFKEIQKASRSLLLILIFCTIITGCIPVITQYLLKLIVSGLENKTSFNNFIFLLGIYAFVSIFKNVLLNAKECVNTIAGYRLAHNIQTRLIEKIRSIEYKMFYSPDFQNSYVTVLQNSQNESSMLVFSTVFLLSLMVQLVSTSIIIVSFNPIIFASLVICSIPNIIINIKIKKEQVKVLEERSQSYRKISYCFGVLTERSCVKEFRIFDLYEFFSVLRHSTFDEYLNIWKKFSKTEFLNKLVATILPCVGVFSSILWMILQVTENKCSISDFIFYSGIIFSFQSVFESLILDVSQVYKSMAFIDRFFNFLNMKNDTKCGNLKLSTSNRHVLEFKNVSFKYPSTETLALKNINLKIETNEQIALVGKNGCGKTTLISLILRIYDPTQGTILLDGIDIKDYDYSEYLKFFSAVFQDYQPYSVSLYDYISFGDIKNFKNLSKIKQAAINATANNFIERSPKGFESNLTTRFDKHGLELSSGQWQKLAIARTFFSDTGMLIFDEPTSALDSISESEIYKNIGHLGKDKMSIFISHRMYSSKLSKRIIHMEDGKITHDGTHQELMQNSAGYKELFEEQANKHVMEG